MKNRRFFSILCLYILICSVCHAQNIPSLHIEVSGIPADGYVVHTISLSSISSSLRAIQPADLQPHVSSAGKNIDAQWVPSPDFNTSFGGTLILYLKGKTAFDGSLTFSSKHGAASSQNITAESPGAQFAFHSKQKGVFPASITLTKSHLLLNDYVWNDRIVDADVKQYFLKTSEATNVQLISSGSIVSVIRVSAAYADNAGKSAPGNPSATYDWYIFKNSPLIYVKAFQTSERPQPWKENHFLEWLFSSHFFTTYAGDNISTPATLTSSKKILNFNSWAALLSSQPQPVMLAAINTSAAIYDGYGEYGTYLLVQNPNAFAGWSGQKGVNAAWLWIGETPTPLITAKGATLNKETEPIVAISTTEASASFAATQKSIAALPTGQRGAAAWKLSLSKQMAQTATAGTSSLPSTWQFFQAGNLGLSLDVTSKGVNLVSLFDVKHQTELSARNKKPLFDINLTNIRSGEAKKISANDVWNQCSLVKQPNGFSVSESFNNYGIDLTATVTATADNSASAWHWKMNIKNSSTEWSISSVIFPQIAIANLGSETKAFYPEGPGVIINQPYANWSFDNYYPGGWATMQYMCIYNSKASTGLYIAREDATAASKNIQAKGNAGANEAEFAFVQPAENLNKAANNFELTGESVWQLLDGDWYDAAMIYKKWLAGHAPWYSSSHSSSLLSKVDLWLQLNGEAATVVPQIETIQQVLKGANIGLHWYNWNTKPFDNDYPHYFPARNGFKEGVSELKSKGVFVMPYLNARLWDTRDDGTKDAQFTNVALQAATKDDKNGKLVPHTETYQSKESDGSPVVFSVMCPYTPLWQDTMKNLVGKLAQDNVSGVYLDEIANASPVLCMDGSHGHPLGGGHWWVDGYNKMLQKMKTSNPDIALTTEENAEPYMKYLDGYLTWYWHFNYMVPAFPAIYSKSVALFGRSFSDQDLTSNAFRMKLAQQLVFGEQLGWIDSKIIMAATGANLSFLKSATMARHESQHYFTVGEMMQPPAFEGNAPAITANWNVDNTMVTTNAVQNGAWKISGEKTMIFIFCNTSDNTVNTSINLISKAYGLPAQWKLTTGNKPGFQTINNSYKAQVSFPANSIAVWKVTW